MRWENLLDFFRSSDDAGEDEVRTIEPRPLTKCEVALGYAISCGLMLNGGTLASIELKLSPRDRATRVSASFYRHPNRRIRNARRSAMRESVGELWIEVDDG